MLHQIPDRGRDTVAAATVKTALSHIERKLSAEIENTMYAIKKIQPWVEIFEQASLLLKWHVNPFSTVRYSSTGDNPWIEKRESYIILSRWMIVSEHSNYKKIYYLSYSFVVSDDN